MTAGPLERIEEAAARHRLRVRPGDTWIDVADPRVPVDDQGWKIHISARPATLGETLDRALPVLLAAGHFKVVRDEGVLRGLNSPRNGTGSAGKAITVYPRQNAVRDIGHALVTALRGLPAPVIGSDRRIAPDAPVYYRYGPFRPRFRMTGNGDFELVVIGPAGEEFPGAARAAYRCPEWASDPFRTQDDPVRRPDKGEAVEAVEADEAAESDKAAEVVVGGRYRLTAGVAVSTRGNVYRGVDLRNGGREVVVKQARAFVGEAGDGTDVRAYLRNERRILHALEDVPCIPRVVDHFRHGDDEFLVVTSAGDRDLRQDVVDHGRYGDGAERGLAGLAADLVRLLDDLHDRGVVYRDLAPKNVALDGRGRCVLVDFDISRYDGTQRFGWTPGYSPPGQRRDQPATPADDHYSLGATLFYAATGLEPVRMHDDPERDVAATLMALGELSSPGDVASTVIPCLLGPDPDDRSAAVADIRHGRVRGKGGAGRPLPPLPPVPDLDGLVAWTLEHLVQQAEEMAHPPDRRPRPVNAYLGTAGVGLELLHHAANAQARRLVADLARHTAKEIEGTRPSHGLLFGSLSASIFLSAVGVGAPREAPRLDGDGLKDDYVHGVAGTGAGHLILVSLDPAGSGTSDLAQAEECAAYLLDGRAGATADGIPASPPGSGVRTEWGIAHGTAGIAYFLLAVAETTNAQETDAERRYADLAVQISGLIEAVGTSRTRPMAGSWCQGLAGIGTSFLAASERLGEDRYLRLAADAGRAALQTAPSMAVVSQCCGMAGVGELLIDLAVATGSEEFLDGARRVLALILARCGGEPDRPIFPDHSLTTSSAQWGVGTAGILTFLRRLRDGGGPRPWTIGWRPPAGPKHDIA